MANARMVTRTIEEGKVKVMLCDLLDFTLREAEFSVPSFVKPEKVLDYIEKTQLDGCEKPVKVLDYVVTETLYGMTEEEFIKNSIVLPPRTKSE